MILIAHIFSSTIAYTRKSCVLQKLPNGFDNSYRRGAQFDRSRSQRTGKKALLKPWSKTPPCLLSKRRNMNTEATMPTINRTVTKITGEGKRSFFNKP